MTNSRVLNTKVIPIRYASFKDPFMDLSKHQGVVTSVLIKLLKNIISSKMWMIHVFTRRLVGALSFS